jgi:RNA polymerase sigma-70 factor (ECF subfamily)
LNAENRFSASLDNGHTDLPGMLAVLSGDECLTMVLSFAYGLSHGEVSEVTSMPISTVKSHIRRGKNRIRERFRTGENPHD